MIIKFAILSILGLTLTSTAKDLNIARVEKHPYVDVSKGRAGYRFAGEQVNEVRLYDFYQRQADYYMYSKNQIPKVIPSYPGLDGGEHGHWGKYNQNNYRDSRWNEMGQSGFMGQQMDSIAPDTISVLLGNNCYAAFSAKANLSFFRFWKGEFVKFGDFRWGTSSGASPKGKMVFSQSKSRVGSARNATKADAKTVGWQVDKSEQKYIGMYDADGGAIFSYKVKGASVLDSVQALEGCHFVRTLEFSDGTPSVIKLALFEASDKGLTLLKNGLAGTSPDGKRPWAVQVEGGAKLVVENQMLILHLSKQVQASQVKLYMSTTETDVVASLAQSSKQTSLAKRSEVRKNRWDKTVTVKGTLAKNDKAYVVDDIPLPMNTANKSLMFMTDIAFDTLGTAYISTLMGEVWQVSGLDTTLDKVVWKKIATGLNQPFGLKIWDGKIHVLEREQITYLEDRNNDGEIDFYGNFSNDFKGLDGSHTHSFGMGRDKEGRTHLVSGWTSYRISKDGNKAEPMVTGLRNCMGFGQMSDGTILVGPQEGTNTPTSTLIEIRKGDNYGFKNKEELSTPLGYIPRGVDNSTGGFLEVDSERWGPLGKKSLIGICYGYGSWYHIMFDKNAAITKHRQIASVPMAGEFSSGVTRGAVNPVDGQVYLVGLDGWGDYSIENGCLHRVRYTGKPLHKPIEYEVFNNGIRIAFPETLDKQSVIQSKNYFAQMWNYNNSRQYGSPEFSIKYPDSLGHDHLPVTSTHLLDDGKSIFVEIPSLQPAMQMHLRMHLKSKAGVTFKTDLFPTIVKQGGFYNFKGAQAKNTTKPNTFVLRSDRDELKNSKLVTQSGKVDEHAKRIKIQTVIGLKYDVLKFKVKAGESVALELHNADAMPHNLVLTMPGKKKKVGEAAFKMLNDPNAIKKSYVPDSGIDVIAHTTVVDPKGTHTTYFTAPIEKGEYPYICTFPGHWQVMQGVMIVE
jgi:azurin